MPTPAQRSELLSIIECLGRRYGTPQFEPHSTLLSGYGSPVAIRTKLVENVRQVCKDAGPITLRADGLGQTEAYFTFFFLRLKGQGFTNAFRRFVLIAPDLQKPRIAPHLSLIYSEPSAGIDRAAVSKEFLPALPAKVTFDAVQIVTPRNGCWDHVQSWESSSPIGLEGSW